MNRATMTVTEMATYLGIGITKAYMLARSKSFYPAFRLGSRILINRDKLDDWRISQRNDRTEDEYEH